MGYTIDFSGSFKITPVLKKADKEFLLKLAETRRMARKVGPEFGVEGEFYVDGKGPSGQDKESNIIDYNRPPKTQPSLWLDWVPTEDGKFLEWNGGEKFYGYVEWLEYLVAKIFEPRGYKLNGQVEWFGEDHDDQGIIIVKDNIVEAFSKDEYMRESIATEIAEDSILIGFKYEGDTKTGLEKREKIMNEFIGWFTCGEGGQKFKEICKAEGYDFDTFVQDPHSNRIDILL